MLGETANAYQEHRDSKLFSEARIMPGPFLDQVLHRFSSRGAHWQLYGMALFGSSDDIVSSLPITEAESEKVRMKRQMARRGRAGMVDIEICARTRVKHCKGTQGQTSMAGGCGSIYQGPTTTRRRTTDWTAPAPGPLALPT
ncbi:hypothetical protein DFJ58DRAFT_839854 [Suillus subalutaceus]|uniref:uncharacterized protein n=1 Tax=Suillus subalutaceus TaxID=48586 RepID=UPI001B860F52|nr:uncharacterized protein DFJ58DRAFT_839854 [Suillus subalutaceus]KAG1860639.1 hypothetical protein DFJ58DRAFT_839854 [Suillus subalutaceus]